MEDDVPTLVVQESGDVPSLVDDTPVQEANLPKVPVTIITGFLGSGKVRRQK